MACSSLLLSVSCVASSLAGPPQVELEPVTWDASAVVYLTHAPEDGNRLFILEREGRVRIFMDGDLLPTPFLDISSQVHVELESGLLGMAFHPEYQNNGLFYLNYTRQGDPFTSVIAEYRTSATNPDLALPQSERVLLEISTQAYHIAGWLGFGPDGYLYAAVGDGGIDSTAQDVNDLRGSMLRIDVDSTSGELPYGIPAGNPLVGKPGRDEIWAIGLRNPYRCSFDRLTGDLWIADVGSGGPQRREEVNVQPAGSSGGENYGWPCMEGSACLDAENCDCPSMMLPFYDYAAGCAIIGGKVYRGCAIPELYGAYVFVDWCMGTIWAAWPNDTGPPTIQTLLTDIAVIGFGEDADGELYICQFIGVQKLVPSTPPNPDPCKNQPPAPGDLNDDGSVNVHDLLILLFAWGACSRGEECPADLTDDGVVGIQDMLVLLNHWG